MRLHSCLTVVTLTMLYLPAVALGQTHPVKTVRIILPVQPGGGLDTQRAGC